MNLNQDLLINNLPSMSSNSNRTIVIVDLLNRPKIVLEQ
jgi:hypothetical protein